MNEFIFLKKPIRNSSLELDDVGILLDDEYGRNSFKIKFLSKNVVISLTKDYFEKFDIKNTGDRHSHKVCDRCFKRLETDFYFSDNRIKKNNVKTKRPSCKSCRKAKDGKAISKADRDKWNLQKPKDYEPFTCPICSKTTIAGLSKIVLDHCHHSGFVRGYLCESCNTGIGRFDDNTKILDRAKDWLNTK